MSRKGIVFSIEEFSVFDGPGIRTTVFFKGCPLRCNWCHNPEGLSASRQLVRSPNGCLHCGKCSRICRHPEGCVVCGDCAGVCPRHLIRVSGEEVGADELAARLMKNADLLTASGGGITFSGGECLMQAEFLTEVTSRLYGKVHLAIQTSGYGEGNLFSRLLDSLDLVMFDLKLMNPESFRRYIGGDNRVILDNFERLVSSGRPYIVRVPLIPGVTDTPENLGAVAEFIAGRPGLTGVELLPYNKLAGSKYTMVGKRYEPLFDEQRTPAADTGVFERRGIPVKVM